MVKRLALVFLGLAISAGAADPKPKPLPESCWQRIGPEQFPAPARNVGQLQAGAKIPKCILYTREGEEFDLNAAIAEKPTILIFFRHVWETLNLGVLNSAKHAYPELQKLGWQASNTSDQAVRIATRKLLGKTA